MASTKTTIELNGTIYDAVTGTPMSHSATPHTPKPAKKTDQPAVMDGFIRNKKVAPASRQPSSAKIRRPERSKTLMRHTMTKPTVAPVASKESSSAQTKSKASLPTQHEAARQERAQKTAKSPLVNRFGVRKQTVDSKVVSNMPVQAPPQTKKVPTSAPAVPRAAVATAAATPTPAVSFTDAMAHARSHEQAPPDAPKARQRAAKKLGVSSRFVSIGAGTLAVLLLVGFFAYQNVANFQMRMAATRAGFSAELPFTPSGFSMSHNIKASPGQVIVSFHSNSDERTFDVIQKESDWTSESLLSNYITANKYAYQTYEDKGRTIYLYDGSNATWVNGGVWYEIKGSSGLNSDQLVQIASSL